MKEKIKKERDFDIEGDKKRADILKAGYKLVYVKNGKEKKEKKEKSR